MKYYFFDQFEFDLWEAEESLVVISETKSLRGTRLSSILDFIVATNQYPRLYPIEVTSDPKKLVASNVNNIGTLLRYCELMCGITTYSQQKFIVHKSEWNVVDVSWETRSQYFRAAWETTA